MAIKMLEDGRIADEFEIGEEPHVLKDALVMRVSDYDSFTPEQIIAMKQARYDNWIAIILAPPVEELPVEVSPVEMPVEDVPADPVV
jgi:hypothetical protein